MQEIKNLTGWQNPMFYVYKKSDNSLLKVIELDFTNGEGLTVEYEEVYNEEELVDYSVSETEPDLVIEQDYLGMRYFWTIDYSDQLSVELGLKIKELLDLRFYSESSQRSEVYFKLKPRKDAQFIYRVIKDPETMRLRVGKGGELSEGDEGFSMRWKTYGLVKPLDWRDPNVSEYIGDAPPVTVGALQT